MTDRNPIANREDWLNRVAQDIDAEIITPALPADNPAYKFRCSVGFLSNRAAPKHAIAVCYAKEASADGFNEIFVSPTHNDGLNIAASLVHELIHASDNCVSGHRNHFARVARAVGLEGPLTATTASTALQETLLDIIEQYGPIPHAPMDVTKARKKQSTRMIKITCNNCGFTARSTMKHIAGAFKKRANGDFVAACPAHDCHGVLIANT